MTDNMSQSQCMMIGCECPPEVWATWEQEDGHCGNDVWYCLTHFEFINQKATRPMSNVRRTSGLATVSDFWEEFNK